MLRNEVIEGTDDSVFELRSPKGKDGNRELNWQPKPGVKAQVPNFGFAGVAMDVRDLRSDRDGDRWTRQTLAVQMLTRMDNPTGWKIIERMAEGHPEAEPTISAQMAMEWRKSGEPFKRWDREKLLANQHQRDWDSLKPLTSRQDQTQAIMGFVFDQPTESVRFFKTKLRPLKLEKKRADELVKQLFSENEQDWKAAIAEFAALGIRLAYPVRDAWKLARTADQRSKMAMVLCQGGAQVMKGLFHYDLTAADETPHMYASYGEEFAKNTLFYMQSLRPDVPKEAADRLSTVEFDLYAPGSFASLNVLLWHREVSAIHILDVIGSDEAIAIIKDMATGHPDAGPTKAAKSVLTRRGIK